MPTSHYCPSQDWDRYSQCFYDDYIEEVEETGVRKHLKRFLGLSFYFKPFPDNNKNHYIDLCLLWGIIRFSLCFYDWRFELFNFTLCSPYYGTNDVSPRLIDVQVERIYEIDIDTEYTQLTVTTLKEVLISEFPDKDVAKYNIWSWVV